MLDEREVLLTVAARLLARESSRTEEACREELMAEQAKAWRVAWEGMRRFRIAVVVFLGIRAGDERDATGGAERAVREALRAQGTVGEDRRVTLTVRDIVDAEHPVKVHGVMSARQALQDGYLALAAPPDREEN